MYDIINVILYHEYITQKNPRDIFILQLQFIFFPFKEPFDVLPVGVGDDQRCKESIAGEDEWVCCKDHDDDDNTT